MAYIKTMGQTEDNMWIVSEGIKEGDRILTTGMQKVIPGKPVRIVDKPQQEEQAPVKQGFFDKLFNKGK